MKLISGIAWTSASQFYMAGVGILVIPYLTDYFGTGQYGVVAFFLMLQSLLNLLDLGFSAGVSKDASKYRNGDISKKYFLSVLFLFFKIFLLIAIISGFSLYAIDEVVVAKWSDQILNVAEAEADLYCIFYSMSIILALRMLSIYFRSVIFGLCDLKGLAVINVVSTTFKFIVPIPFLYIFQLSLLDYFLYQLVIQVFELIFLIMRCWRLVGFSFEKIDSVPAENRTAILTFVLGVGLSSITWILISNVDKLYTSSLLSLEELGFLHIAVTISGVVTVLTAPVMNAVVPRVTMLFSSQKIEELEYIFKLLSLIVAASVLPVISVSVIFGEQLLAFWFSNAELARSIILPFQCYLVGNFFLAMASMSYPFSLADGRMKLRNISSVTLLLFLLVTLPIAILKWGVLGASLTWATAMVLYWLVWQPLLVKQFSDGLFLDSFLKDILPIILVNLFSTFVFLRVEFSAGFLIFVWSVLYYLSVVFFSCLSSNTGRKFLVNFSGGVWALRK